MQLSYIIAVFSATVAMAAPNPAPEEAPALEPRACLPASCQSFGCCSGDCDYWCRACDISFTC